MKEYKDAITPIGSRAQLHEKIINSMQSCYGVALRQKLNDKYEMKKSIVAKLFHSIDITDAESRHRFCPPGEEKQCKYKLPKLIYYIVPPVFDALIDDELLSKYFFLVRCRTQMSHVIT